MRPTFLGFETGRKGLMTVQKGLDITGQNLTNLNTAGYTRQRIDQVSVATSSYKSRLAGTRTDFAGQGVEISGISQTRDKFLDKRFREEFSDNSYYDQKVGILGDIGSIVDEYSNADTGLLSALNTISKAIQEISGVNSEDKASANILNTAFKGIVNMLKEYDNKLNKVAEQHKYDLSVDVTEVNNILSKLAGLNKQISADIGLNKSELNIYGPNELMDERNLLLDQLAQYGDIDVKEEENGSVTIKMGGKEVLRDDEYDLLNYTEHAEGTVSLSWSSDAQDARFTSGAFKSYVELINGRGPNIQSKYESPERGVLYYKDKLNTLAQTFVTAVNSVIPVNVDANGDPVADPVSGKVEYKQLMGALVTDENGTYTTVDTAVTAANISISDEWTADVTYVIPRDNSFKSKYFSKLNDVVKNNDNISFYSNGQTFTGSFVQYINDVSNTCNADISFNEGRLDATGAVTDELLNRRDAISGVSRDEETSNMMMYQKSFQAVSRLMTAMDEALDVVINKMGLVGR